ncbi:MAG: hypothetical protein ACTTKH_00015 [Treponema sp.]
MKRINIIFLFGLCPIIITSSFIAYSIIMVASLWVFFLFSLLADFVSRFLELKNRRVFEFFFGITLYLIYLKVIEIVFPVIFISLTPYLYLLCFSYIMYFCFDEYEKNKYPSLLIKYSLLFFALSFVRELLSFGSVSLPAFYGIASFNIFELLGLSAPFRFLGSSAGTLIMLGLFASFYFWYANDEPMYVKEKIK